MQVTSSPHRTHSTASTDLQPQENLLSTPSNRGANIYWGEGEQNPRGSWGWGARSWVLTDVRDYFGTSPRRRCRNKTKDEFRSGRNRTRTSVLAQLQSHCLQVPSQQQPLLKCAWLHLPWANPSHCSVGSANSLNQLCLQNGSEIHSYKQSSKAGDAVSASKQQTESLMHWFFKQTLRTAWNFY